jgi:hypothetical protein
MAKTLKNIRRVIPGNSRHLTSLRGKSIDALARWETRIRRSKNKELELRKNAASALKNYANAMVEEEENKVYIGTAKNMSGYAPHPVPEKFVLRSVARPRRNLSANKTNQVLSGVGLNENLNRIFRGGRRRSKAQTRRK